MREVSHYVFHSMGIPIHITLVGVSNFDFEHYTRKLVDIFNFWDQKFSRFKIDSELSNVNNNAGSWTSVSLEMFTVIELCVNLAQETNGVFDPSVGCYLAAAGYGLPENYNLPSPVPTFRNVIFDKKNLKIKLAPKQILEPAALVKALAIDACGLALQPVSAWMINAGGDILSHGDFPVQGYWNIGIQYPKNKNAIVTTIQIKNAAVATSGIYETKWENQGKSYNHQINMKNGEPLSEIQSVTIVAETVEIADVTASIVILLGLKKGIDYISEKKLPYFIIDDNDQIYKNDKFSELEINVLAT